MGRRKRGRSTAYVLATAACGAVALSLPAGAAAQTHAAGGAYATPSPRVSSVQCVRQCSGVRSARTESLVRLRGKHLEYTDAVVFLGAPGAEDDVLAEPVKVRSSHVVAAVPPRARTGAVAIVTADGQRSKPARKRLGITAARSKSSGDAIELEIPAHKFFYDAARQPAVTFMVRRSAHVLVELLRETDGSLVHQWDVGLLEAGTPETVTWDGKSEGKVQPEGRYVFRVLMLGEDGAVTASTSQAGDDTPGSFLFLRHKFPIRGPHDYGGSVAAFGGGRGHQGQDVFARCGTPLVAARGGTVKLRQRQSRAGNYLVIDGEGTGVDYVYMHLRDKALVAKGDRVRTGQLIGYIGDTGHAHGCHLHFELWDGPGWYTGGRPFDPLADLKAWDRQS